MKKIITAFLALIMLSGMMPAMSPASAQTTVLPPNDTADEIVQFNSLSIAAITDTTAPAIITAVANTAAQCQRFDATTDAALPCSFARGEQYTLQVGAETRLLLRGRQRGQLADFAVGDRVNVYGFYDRATKTIEALILRDLDKPLAKRFLQLNNVEIYTLPSATLPTTLTVFQRSNTSCLDYGLTGVSATMVPCPLGPITADREAAQKYAITITANTKLLSRVRGPLSVTDLKVGDVLNVYGIYSEKDRLSALVPVEALVVRRMASGIVVPPPPPITPTTTPTTTVSAPMLYLSRSSLTAPARQLTMGSTGNSLLTVNLSAGTIEDVRVTDITITDTIGNSGLGEFSNFSLWDGATQVAGPISSQTVSAGTASITFHLSSGVTVSRNSTKNLELRADVIAYSSGGARSGATHTFGIAPASAVVAIGMASNGVAAVSGTPVTSNTMTIYRTKVTLSSTMLGAVSGRTRTAVDDLATLNFSANSSYKAVLQAVTIQFSGTALRSGASSFSVELLDSNTNALLGAAASQTCLPVGSTVSGSCSVTFLPQFTLDAGTTKATKIRINSANLNGGALSATITNTTDVQVGDGTTTNIPLEANAVPFALANVSYEGSTVAPTSTPSITPSVTMLFPNGGEQIPTGPNNYWVRFDLKNISGLTSPTVSLELLKDGVLLGSRSLPAYTDPAYWNFSWEVGSYGDANGVYRKASPGTGYKLRAVLRVNGAIVASDETNATFSIVSPPSIDASFTAMPDKTSGSAPLTVNFMVTLKNYPSCGAVSTWSWGDGGVQTRNDDCLGSPQTLSSRSFAMTHTFAAAGISYPVYLQVNGKPGLPGLQIATIVPTSPASLKVSGVSPSTGPVGVMVTVTGSGFTSSGNNVGFWLVSSNGGTSRTISNIASPNGTTLSFPVPATLTAYSEAGNKEVGVVPGQYQFVVDNANGKSGIMNFTVTGVAPSFVAQIGTDTPPARTLSAGTSAVEFARINFMASGASVNITQLSIGSDSVGAAGSVANVKVVDGSTGAILGSASSIVLSPATISTGQLSYADIPVSVTVPANQTKSIRILADIPSSAQGSVRLGVTGFNLAENNVNIGGTGAVFGHLVTITNGGTLSLSGSLLGPSAGRIKTVVDDVGQVGVAVSSGYKITLQAIRISLKGSALGIGTNVINSLALIDPYTGMPMEGGGAGACNMDGALDGKVCWKTFNFASSGGLTIDAGTTRMLKARLNSALMSPDTLSPTLTTYIAAASDVLYDSNGSTGLTPSASQFPLTISSVLYEGVSALNTAPGAMTASEMASAAATLQGIVSQLQELLRVLGR